MNRIDSLLEFKIHDMQISLDELVAPYLPPKVLQEYMKLDKLISFHRAALKHGWDAFDWKKAHDLGWTCKKDYTVFAEELKGLDPDEYMKKAEIERKQLEDQIRRNKKTKKR